MLYIFCAHEQNCYLIKNIKRRTVCRFCALYFGHINLHKMTHYTFNEL